MKSNTSAKFIAILVFSIVLISFLQLPLFAQKTNNDTLKNQSKNKITLFYEKVYLHTDRSYYSSGDDLWFKAYLVNAISNIPLSETSNNLYVELISPESKIIEHKLIRLNGGMGNGDFKLPDSIPGGNYKLRAYTNWMRNFGDIFLFEKNLHIYSIPGIKANITKTTKQIPTIQFFPESGSLINEAINNIAFKALNETGKSCNAKGVIISSENDTACWFNSSYLGMGTFAYMPIEGQHYFAVGTLNETFPFKVELPLPITKGYGMKIYDADTASFYISIYTNQATLDKSPNAQLIINCMSHNKNNFTGSVTVNSLKKDIRMLKRNLPEGITSITLYDTLIHPQCQRLIYIHKKNNLVVTFTTNKTEYQPREEVAVNFKVTDTNGNPVKTELSLSAIDNGLVPDDISNMESYLLLESEVKGNIEDPKNYFNPANPLRYKQLDLLLLTQGWRDFTWRRIRDSVPTIKYMVEPGINLSGKVRQKFINNPIPNSSVTLYIPKTVKNKLLFTHTNKDGNYYIDGVEFYGTQNVILTTSNTKGKNTGWIFLDDPDSTRYPIHYQFPENDGFLNYSKFTSESAYRKNITKQYSLKDTIQLAEVVISAEKTKQDKILRNYAMETGSQPEYIFKITAADYNLDLGTFFLTKIPRARLDTEPSTEGSTPLNRVLFSVSGEKEPPRFIVDGRSFEKGNLTDENFVYNLPLEGIDEILVSFSDALSGSSAAGTTLGVAISIITNPKAFQKMNFYTINKSLNGYYESRTFYSPVYPNPNFSASRPDLRTTLFWNPNLTTNEKGECSTTFFNTDKNTSVKLTIQGITDNGIPIVHTATYEIKK